MHLYCSYVVPHTLVCYLIAKLDIFHQGNSMLRFIGYIFWNIDYGPWIEHCSLFLLLSLIRSLWIEPVFRTKKINARGNQQKQPREEEKKLSHSQKSSPIVNYYCWPKWHVNTTNREFYELNFIFRRNCSIEPCVYELSLCMCLLARPPARWIDAQRRRRRRLSFSI